MNKEFNQYYLGIKRKQKRDNILFTILVLSLYFYSSSFTEFSITTLIERLPNFFDYIYMTLPTLHFNDLFVGKINGHLVKGSLAYWGYRLNIQIPLLWDTINMALSASIIGCFLAIFISFFAAKNTDTPAYIRMPILFTVAFLRTMPEFAWAIMFVMAFGIGVIPGFLALTLHSIGCNTKLNYEVIESISLKPVQGLKSCGANKLQFLRFGVWPQIKPNIIALSFMRFEISFRQSTVLGLVGAGGIGQELMTNIKLNHYDQVSMTILLIISVVILIDIISSKLLKYVLEGQKG